MKKLILFVLATFLVISLSALFVSAEGTNIAVGKSYTYTGEYFNEDKNAIDYPDSTPGKLTDGVIAGAGDVGYNSPLWIGLNQSGKDVVTGGEFPQNSIVLDLEEVQEELTKVVLYAQECDGGIVRPKQVEIFISDDDSTYTSIGKAAEERIVDVGTDEKPDFGIYTYTLVPAESFSARYVKFTIDQGAWAFVCEVEVYAGGEITDPTSQPDEESEPEESDDESEPEESDDESEVSSVEESDDKSPAESVADEDEEGGLGTGTIIGIVAGAIVVIGGIVFFATRKK